MLEPDQVHEMDCFTALPNVPDESVEIVLTDPPYPNRLDLFTNALVDGYAAVYLACKKAKNYVVFFWNPQDVPTAPPGWYEVARHVWHKPDTRSITHYETIVVWSRESKRKVSRVWSIPILDYRSLKDWKPHPTQKPVKLLRYLLDLYTKEGDTVLDPFVGSGSTAIACLQTGRHCIAIERDPEYARIAQDRVRELHERGKRYSEQANTTSEDPGLYEHSPPLTRPQHRRTYKARPHRKRDNVASPVPPSTPEEGTAIEPHDSQSRELDEKPPQN